MEFPFGFGLSYTDFSIQAELLTVTGKNSADVSVMVTNTGHTYTEKEVVQVYVSCPQKELAREYRRLCGFAKTAYLQPGESEKIKISIHARDLAYFAEENSAWMLDAGLYGIWVGNSSRNVTLAGVLQIPERVLLEETEHICPLQEELNELNAPSELRKEQEKAWHTVMKEKQLVPVVFEPEAEQSVTWPENEFEKAARELTEKLTQEQMIAMVIGEVSRGQGQTQTLGAAGIMVPGAAGETSSILEKEYGVPGVSMADGPAGLRLMKSYEVNLETGGVYNQGILGALEGGFFASQKDHEKAERWYQYCTAIPVGTMLAQTWNVDLMEAVGEAVVVEMEEFGISWWLAPGMNIHRNPLCGRNFEYYSEDPYVSGHMAAAITRGVQRYPGVGTTIKHLACNNQEDNRKGSDSILSERVLREIYLRGFEIAVKESQPMAIMTSYNLINGVHTANSKELCMQAVRNEWGFKGIIMTDWTTTMPNGGSLSWKCVEAGNDLIMPGYDGDFESIRGALASGELSMEDLKACVARMLTVIFQTNAYENAGCYGTQFGFQE